MTKRLIRITLLLACISSVTGCLYFNLYYNFKKAYGQAVEFRDDRITDNPGDTAWVTKPEKEKLQRTINKGSKILEVYPAEIEYKPHVLFFMADAFYRMGRWEKAIVKYNEYEKYFPGHDSIPSAQYHRAYCHYKSNELPVAYYELRQILEKGQTHQFYNSAVLLLAEVSQGETFSKSAIENIENLLKSDISSDYIKGKLHYQLAQLYFSDEKYSKALPHFSDPTVEELTDLKLYTAFHKSLECLYNTKEYTEGLTRISKKIAEPRFALHLFETEILQSKFLMKVEEYDKAITILDTLIVHTKDSNKRITSEAYYILAEHLHYTIGDLENARLDYKNSYDADKKAPWSKIALKRSRALRRVYSIRKTKKKTFKDFFKAAELYLFTLSNPDSAINNLEQLSKDTAESPEILARAQYAKAFIIEEFKGDDTLSQRLYAEIIEKYPESKYAQQAEQNLGLTPTVKTKEDRAYERFLNAENLYFSLDSISLVNPVLYDSLELIAVAQYDSVATEYPQTAYGMKAHYTLAWIYEVQRADTAAARIKYQHIVDTYPKSPYATVAKQKLKPKITVTEAQIEKLKKRLNQSIKREDQRKKRIEKQQKDRYKINEAEELLETDYNKMYEFGK